MSTFHDGDDTATGDAAALYSSLAEIYDRLYAEKVDYDQQYRFCNEYLERYDCDTVLELGCGTGRLTHRLNDTYTVTGVDASDEMLAIARERTDATLVQADIRDLDMEQRYDAVVMLGRTFTHMTTDDDVAAALDAIAAHLHDGGVLIMDNFRKDGIAEMTETEEYTVDGLRIERENDNHDFDADAGTWTWTATYTITDTDTGEETRVVDEMVLRSFSEAELEQYLAAAGFETLRHFANIYFEQTSEAAKFVTVARKDS